MHEREQSAHEPIDATQCLLVIDVSEQNQIPIHFTTDGGSYVVRDYLDPEYHRLLGRRVHLLDLDAKCSPASPDHTVDDS